MTAPAFAAWGRPVPERETRWNHFEPRDDDVIVSPAYKAGTTWIQMICGLLIFQKNYSDGSYQLLDTAEYMEGNPMPRCPENIREFWQGWIGRSWFDWESEGYPFWSFFHHIRTWWDFRDLPTTHFVHYNDLKADLAGEMRKIAVYLDIRIDEKAPTSGGEGF